jgi:hypothetical protein
VLLSLYQGRKPHIRAAASATVGWTATRAPEAVPATLPRAVGVAPTTWPRATPRPRSRTRSWVGRARPASAAQATGHGRPRREPPGPCRPPGRVPSGPRCRRQKLGRPRLPLPVRAGRRPWPTAMRAAGVVPAACRWGRARPPGREPRRGRAAARGAGRTRPCRRRAGRRPWPTATPTQATGRRWGMGGEEERQREG